MPRYFYCPKCGHEIRADHMYRAACPICAYHTLDEATKLQLREVNTSENGQLERNGHPITGWQSCW